MTTWKYTGTVTEEPRPALPVAEAGRSRALTQGTALGSDPLPLGNLVNRNITLHFGGSRNVQGRWDKAVPAIAAGQADRL